MVKNCILSTTDESDIVLDPFMGSGTTAVACVDTKRNFIGIELDNGIYNLAKERIKKSIEYRSEKYEN